MYGAAACKVVVTCSQITKDEFDTLRSQFTELSSRMALTALKSDQLFQTSAQLAQTVEQNQAQVAQELLGLNTTTEQLAQTVEQNNAQVAQELLGLNTVVESVMNTVDATVEDLSGLKTFCTALSEAVEIEPVAGEPGPITYPPS